MSGNEEKCVSITRKRLKNGMHCENCGKEGCSLVCEVLNWDACRFGPWLCMECHNEIYEYGE